MSKLLCHLFSALALALLWGTPLLASAQTTVRYIHTDVLGSVMAVTDQSGNVMERREYEPYGAQLVPAVQGGPGYTGHVQDAATGLTYMQQRYYDPGVGLFLSADPVTAYDDPVGQFHRYRYANNNPYKFTDPDGRDAIYFTDTRTLVFPVHFTGSGATAENIEKVRASVNSMKSEDPRVQRVLLAVLEKPGGAGASVMDLSPGKKFYFGSRGEGAEVGGQYGHIDSNRWDTPDAAKHDIAHFAGATDGYTMRGGEAVNVDDYQDHHVMGRNTGGDTLRARDVDRILDNPSTYKFRQSEHGTK